MLPPLILAVVAAIVILIILWAAGVFNKKLKERFLASNKYPYQRTATGWKATGAPLEDLQSNGYPAWLNDNFATFDIVFSQGVYLPNLDARNIGLTLMTSVSSGGARPPSQMFTENLRDTTKPQNAQYCMRYDSTPTFTSKGVMASNTSDVASQITNNWNASLGVAFDWFSAKGSIDKTSSSSDYLSQSNTSVQQEFVNYQGELNQQQGHPECYLNNLDPQFLADFYVLTQQFVYWNSTWSQFDENNNFINGNPGFIYVTANDPMWSVYDTFLEKYGSHICTSETFGTKLKLSYSDQSSTSDQLQDISNKFCATLGISSFNSSYCTGSSVSDQTHLTSALLQTEISAVGGNTQTRGGLATVTAMDIINKDPSAIAAVKTFMSSDPKDTDAGMEYEFTPIWQIILFVMKDWFTVTSVQSTVPANIQQILMTTLPVQYQNAQAISTWLTGLPASSSNIFGLRARFPNFLQMMQTAYARFAVVGSADPTFINANPFKIQEPISNYVKGLYTDFQITWRGANAPGVPSAAMPFPTPGTNNSQFILHDADMGKDLYIRPALNHVPGTQYGTFVPFSEYLVQPNYNNNPSLANWTWQLSGPNADGSYFLQVSSDGSSFTGLTLKNATQHAGSTDYWSCAPLLYLSAGLSGASQAYMQCNTSDPNVKVMINQVPGGFDSNGYYSYTMTIVNCGNNNSIPITSSECGWLNDGMSNFVYGSKDLTTATKFQFHLKNPPYFPPIYVPAWTCPVPIICNGNTPCDIGSCQSCSNLSCAEGYFTSGVCKYECATNADCRSPQQCINNACQ